MAIARRFFLALAAAWALGGAAFAANPIEMAFAKLKALLEKAAARTLD